jgi:solute carrier family 26, other
MAVVGGVFASMYIDLGSYDVNLIGSIPTGLPTPEFPPVELFSRVAVDSIAIAIVSYTINVSMAFIFAKRQNYEIRANQELLALVGDLSVEI